MYIGLLLWMMSMTFTLRHMFASVLCMSLLVIMSGLLVMGLFNFVWLVLLFVTVELIQLFGILFYIHTNIRGLNFIMFIVLGMWLFNLFYLHWRSEICASTGLLKLLFHVARLRNYRHLYFNICVFGWLSNILLYILCY